MSKRVLIFSLAYYPKYVAGAEVAIKEITDRIPPSDAVFDMITLKFDSALPSFEKIGNVNVYRIGFSKKNPTDGELLKFPLYGVKILFPVLAFLKASRLHRKHPYDVLWSMMSYMGFPALFMKMAHPSIRFLLTLQEGDSIQHITKRRRIKAVSSLYKKVFKRADFVQVISNYLGGFAKDMGATCPIETIPNGVDIEKFQVPTSKTKSEEARKRLGIKQNEIILITTSRLVEKNGVEDIIDALQYLPEDTKLLILGSGPLEKDLKSKAKGLKLESRIAFLNFIAHKHMPEYLHAADIFVRPSLSEGMGNSFIEAMAAEVPVIATSVGGIGDFLKDGETGVFCGVRNPKSIAERVVFLRGHRDVARVMVQNAKKMVKEKYDWNLIAERMKKIFTTI